MAIVCPGKFIYLATPHTGSMSMERALRKIPGAFSPHLPKAFGHHGTLSDIKKELGDSLTGTELVVATVRNPYDIAVSWYLRNRGQPRYGGREATLAEFLSRFIKVSPTPLVTDGRIFSLAEKAKVVFRYERLRYDFDSFLRKIPGAPSHLQMGRENITPNKKHWSLYYTDEAYSLMNDAFRDDFVKYGYSFTWPSQKRSDHAEIYKQDG
jgi:hypothetical protein